MVQWAIDLCCGVMRVFFPLGLARLFWWLLGFGGLKESGSGTPGIFRFCTGQSILLVDFFFFRFRQL